MDISIHNVSAKTVNAIDKLAKQKKLSRSQFLENLIEDSVERMLFQIPDTSSSMEANYHELVEKLCGVVENNTAALARQSSVIEKLLYETEEQDAEILPTDTLE